MLGNGYNRSIETFLPGTDVQISGFTNQTSLSFTQEEHATYYKSSSVLLSNKFILYMQSNARLLRSMNYFRNKKNYIYSFLCTVYFSCNLFTEIYFIPDV